jgi:hypothetical protein
MSKVTSTSSDITVTIELSGAEAGELEELLWKYASKGVTPLLFTREGGPNLRDKISGVLARSAKYAPMYRHRA